MLTVRNDASSLINAMILAHNQAKIDGLSTFFHLTQSQEVSGGSYDQPTITRPTAPAAVTVDTDAWALANSLITPIANHFADQTAHDTVASTATTFGACTDTTSAVALVNDLKAVLNVHFTQAGAHFTDDNTNTVTNADSTDDPTMQVLLNELAADVYAHWASAPTGTYINVVPA